MGPRAVLDAVVKRKHTIHGKEENAGMVETFYTYIMQVPVSNREWLMGCPV
jgi:hypothetical protein